MVKKVIYLCTDSVLLANMAPLPSRDQRHPWLRGQAPKKVTDVDLFYLRSMDQGTANRDSRMVGALTVAEDALVVDEVAQADPAPVQVPQPPPLTPRNMTQRITRLEEEV
nr:hypothetical protein [Tanacetum cinerariifolium]